MHIKTVPAPTGSAEVDYANIQKAIAAVRAAGGGQVSLRPGIYAVHLAIEMPDNVILRGSGCRTTTIRFKNKRPRTGKRPQFPAAIAKYHHAVIRIIGKHDVQIADLCIDGNKCRRTDTTGSIPDDYFPGIAIRSSGMTEGNTPAASPWTIENSQVSAGESRDCRISSCLVVNCPGTGIVLEGARRITLSQCETYNNGDFGIYIGSYTHFCQVKECTSRRNPHGSLELMGGGRHHLVESCILDNVVLQSFGLPILPSYTRVSRCIIGPNHQMAAVIVNGQSFATIEECTIITDAGMGVLVTGPGFEDGKLARTREDFLNLVQGVRISGNTLVASPVLTRALVSKIACDLYASLPSDDKSVRGPIADALAALSAAGIPSQGTDPNDPKTGKPAPHIPTDQLELKALLKKLDKMHQDGLWTWKTTLSMVNSILTSFAFERQDLPRNLVKNRKLDYLGTDWEQIMNFLPDSFFTFPEGQNPKVESTMEIQYPWDTQVPSDPCRNPVGDLGYVSNDSGIVLQYAFECSVLGNRIIGRFNAGLLLVRSRGIHAMNNLLVGSDQWRHPATPGLEMPEFYSGKATYWHGANRPYQLGIFIQYTLASTVSANYCRGYQYGIHEAQDWNIDEKLVEAPQSPPTVGYNFVLDNQVEENQKPFGTRQATSIYRMLQSNQQNE